MKSFSLLTLVFLSVVIFTACDDDDNDTPLMMCQQEDWVGYYDATNVCLPDRDTIRQDVVIRPNGSSDLTLYYGFNIGQDTSLVFIGVLPSSSCRHEVDNGSSSGYFEIDGDQLTIFTSSTIDGETTECTLVGVRR